MEAFPGRFPNEIMDSLDIGLYVRILTAQQMQAIEKKRRRWLSGDPIELTPDDWVSIREIDDLLTDGDSEPYTMAQAPLVAMRRRSSASETQENDGDQDDHERR